MRILITQDTDWIRRNPIQHTHLAERLVLRGHEVRVVDYEILWRGEGDGKLVANKKIFNISRVVEGGEVLVVRPSIAHLPLLDYVSMLFTYTVEIRKQMISFMPDIIISNDILTTFISYRLAKRYHIPVVYYVIDVEYRLVPYKFLQPIAKLVESRNLFDADVVIAINDGLKEHALRMGAKQNRTMVLGAGVDTNKYNTLVSGRKIRKRYNINDSDIILFFMGWLYDFSGIREVVTDAIRSENRNIKLMVVGDGDILDELRKVVEDNDAESKIILVGWKPYKELPQYIAASDICLLPMQNNDITKDIVPIKMYDYMAMGKPIIATSTYGLIKEFGYDSGVVYVDNANGVVAKAMNLVKDGSLELLGEKASQFVKNRDWDTITDNFENILVGLGKCR